MEDTRQPDFRSMIAFSAVFLVLFYLCVWLVIDTRMLYETDPRFPVFFTGPTFLKSMMTRYGGPLDYVSGFLAQSYYLRWLGAAVIALVTGLICLATDVILRSIGGGRARFIALIPGVLVLVAEGRCFSDLTLLVGLLAALAFAILYMKLPVQRDLPRAGLFLVLSVLLYLAAGGPFLLFAALAAVFELFARRRRLPALFAFLSIEAIPYVLGMHVLGLDLTDACAYALPYHPDTGMWGLKAILAIYLLVPVAAAAVGAWRRAISRPDAEVTGSGAESLQRPQPFARRGLLARLTRVKPHPVVGWLLCLALSAAAVFLSYDRRTMASLRIDQYARDRIWEEILAEAREVPVEYYSRMTAQHVNEALYHTGRLPYEMFRYPQRDDSLLFDMTLSTDVDEQNARIREARGLYHQIGDLDLRLGLVNEAEREAHETLAVYGEHGCVLYRLALINIAKKQPEAARMFLRTLRRHLIYGRRADRLLRRLQADPLLSTDPEIQRIRSVMLRADEVGADSSGEHEYLELLESNRHNRMAFEYLMALYLLTRNLDEFAANLPRLRDFDYPDLPRHYQETILLYETDTSKRADRCGYDISDDVLQEFVEFSRDLGLCAGGRDRVATKALTRKYGGTYFHYFHTGLSGLGDQ